MAGLMHGLAAEQSVIVLICVKCHILPLINLEYPRCYYSFLPLISSIRLTFVYSFAFSELDKHVVNFPA